jgi:hypothetical protein
MAHEVTVPLLPCASIDEMVLFRREDSDNLTGFSVVDPCP